MQVKRLTRAESKAQTRDRLLEAAARLFAQRGFGAVTLDSVAEAAGFTKGAVYSNFASKEELYFALAHERIQGMMRTLVETLGSGHTKESKLEALGRWFARVVDEDRDWILLGTEFCLHAARDPRLQDRLASKYAQERFAISAVITEQCRELGVTPPMPAHALASAVIALGEGLGMQRLLDPGSVPDGLFPAGVALLLGLG